MTTSTKKPPRKKATPQRTYDSREKDLAMTAHALSIGSGDQEAVVRAILAEEDLEIPFGTVSSWCYRNHRDRYMQIREEVGDLTRAQLADDATRFAGLAGRVVEKALRQLEEALDRGELQLKELPKVVKEAAVAHGIGVDKAEKLNDRPSTRIAIDVPSLLRDLQGMGMEVIEGTAEEEADDDSSSEPVALLPAGS